MTCLSSELVEFEQAIIVVEAESCSEYPRFGVVDRAPFRFCAWAPQGMEAIWPELVPRRSSVSMIMDITVLDPVDLQFDLILVLSNELENPFSAEELNIGGWRNEYRS